MQAMKVYRLADGPVAARLYLDGRRVSRAEWRNAHCWRYTDCYATRTETRRDGSVIVRDYHNIRVRKVKS